MWYCQVRPGEGGLAAILLFRGHVLVQALSCSCSIIEDNFWRDNQGGNKRVATSCLKRVFRVSNTFSRLKRDGTSLVENGLGGWRIIFSALRKSFE